MTTTAREYELVSEAVAMNDFTEEELIQKLDRAIRYGRRMLGIASDLQTSLFPKAYYFTEAAGAFRFVANITQALAARCR